MAVLLGLYILAVTAFPSGLLGPDPDADLGPAMEMVGVERFELPALWSQTRCATRLRYTPTLFSYPSFKRISSTHRVRMSIYLLFAQLNLIASDYNRQMQTRPNFYV